MPVVDFLVVVQSRFNQVKQNLLFKPDVGLCKFRGTDESELDWGWEKWRQDEEGAVGYVTKHRLGKFGFALLFNHSQRYLGYAEKEDK
jgi:hypothetical protein